MIGNAEHNRKIWGFHVSWNCQERKPALKRKCTISKKYLLSHVSDTHWGPYIIKSVPRYPLEKPSRDSARIGYASLCSRLGSRRFEMLMFDNKNTGMKISRRTDSNKSRTREFFFGYTHHAIVIHHSAPNSHFPVWSLRTRLDPEFLHYLFSFQLFSITFLIFVACNKISWLPAWHDWISVN